MSAEIATYQQSLPTTIDDLAKFVLVGREKLVSVRAAIRAIDKVKLAQEVRQQKLLEAQDIADAVLDAEVRIGELTSRIPKAPYILITFCLRLTERTRTNTISFRICSYERRRIYTAKRGAGGSESRGRKTEAIIWTRYLFPRPLF